MSAVPIPPRMLTEKVEGMVHEPSSDASASGEGLAARRVQLSRAKGWRKPENTVVVARPSKWGNPFKVGDSLVKTGGALVCEVVDSATAADVVAAFRHALENPKAAPVRENIRANLAGKNLACWCRLDAPCHADVLLELANRPEQPE